jgi:hypothetical protein
MRETGTSGRFLVMALDLDDSVKIFGAYLSEELAEQAVAEFEKVYWRFSEWRVEALKPALNSGR